MSSVVEQQQPQHPSASRTARRRASAARRIATVLGRRVQSRFLIWFLITSGMPHRADISHDKLPELCYKLDVRKILLQKADCYHEGSAACQDGGGLS